MMLADDLHTCAVCGYSESNTERDDFCPQCNMTYWKCAACGFIFTASRTQTECPECQEMDLSNITYYSTGLKLQVQN